MNPMIVHRAGKDHAFLVDLHALVKMEGRRGDVCIAAVDIGNLRAGGIDRVAQRPKPCVLVAGSDDWLKKPLLWRGVFPDAAEALLRMARRSIHIDGEGRATLGKENCDHVWQFFTGWTWSLWQQERRDNIRKWTLSERWECIKKLGYPHTESAFRKMCSQDLKLSVTNSSPFG